MSFIHQSITLHNAFRIVYDGYWHTFAASNMADTRQEKQIYFRWKYHPGSIHSPPFTFDATSRIDRMRPHSISREGRTVVCDAYRQTAASAQTLHAIPPSLNDLLEPGSAPFNGEHGHLGYIFDDMSLTFDGLFPLYDACMDPLTTGRQVHQLYGLLDKSIQDIVSANMKSVDATDRTKTRISNLSEKDYISEPENQLNKLNDELAAATVALDAFTSSDKSTDTAVSQAAKRAAAALVRDKTAEKEKASIKINASLRNTKAFLKDALVKYKEMCYRVLFCPDVRFPEEKGDVDFCVTYSVTAKPTLVDNIV